MQRNAARLEMFSIDIADRHLRRRRRCHLSCHLFRRHIRRHPCRPHHHHHEYAMHALPLLRCSPFAIAAAATRLIDSNWSCLGDRHLLLLLLQDDHDDDDDNDDDHDDHDHDHDDHDDVDVDVDHDNGEDDIGGDGDDDDMQWW